MNHKIHILITKKTIFTREILYDNIKTYFCFDIAYTKKNC